MADNNDKTVDTEQLIADLKQKILDPVSLKHRECCLKAGLMPHIAYSRNFCEHLCSLPTHDEWVEIKDDKPTFISDGLKAIKRAWVKQRAAAKSEEEELEAKMAAEQAKQAMKNMEANAPDESASNEEKINFLKEKIVVLKNNIKNLEKERKDAIKAGEKAVKKGEKYEDDEYLVDHATSTKDLDNQLSQQIDELNKEIEITETEIEELKKEIKEAAKKAEKDKKGIQWWYKRLKKYKQEEFDKEAECDAIAIPRKVDDEYFTDDLILLASYAHHTNNGEEGTYTWEEYKADEDADTPELEHMLNNTLKEIWKRFSEITSIANDLDPAILESADDFAPDVTGAAFAGAISNTFEATMMGIELIKDPKIIEQRAKFLGEASLAIIAKLNNRVTAKTVNAIAQIADITPFTAIPIDAAQEMLNHILTPAQVMQIIQEQMAQPSEWLEKKQGAMNEWINETTGAFNDKVKELDFLVGDYIRGFNTIVNTITTTINQGPDWYLDALNNIEGQTENKVCKIIDDTTATVLDYKFMARDTAVEVLAFMLVKPLNDALLEAQIFIVKQTAELIKYAIALAKCLAMQALLLLMGLMGL